MAPKIEDFGKIFVSKKDGQDYLRIPGCKPGIKADAAKPFKGIVEQVIIHTSLIGVKLQNMEEPFYLHRNWLLDNRMLEKGDEIEGIIHVTGDQDSAWYIRRVVKEVKSAI